MIEPHRLVVLGLGNVLCADDGLGIAAVERLARRWELGPGVEVLDGGTLGLSLMAYLSSADELLIVDAIRAEGPPGTRVRLEGDEVAPAVRERLSVHQIGVADLLDGLRLIESHPRKVALLGLVPESLELHLGLSPPVEAELDGLVETLVAEIRARGYSARAREQLDEDTPAHVLAHGDRPRRALGLS